MAVAAFGGAALWRRFVAPRLAVLPLRVAEIVAITLIMLGPVALLDRFRFDVEPMKLFARQIGETVGRTVPTDSRIVVVDAADPGFYPLVVNYALDGRAHVIGAISSLTEDPLGTLRRLIRDQHATHLLALAPDPTVSAITEIELPHNAASLLTREADGQWQVTRSWVLPASGGLKSAAR